MNLEFVCPSILIKTTMKGLETFYLLIIHLTVSREHRLFKQSEQF